MTRGNIGIGESSTVVGRDKMLQLERRNIIDYTMMYCKFASGEMFRVCKLGQRNVNDKIFMIGWSLYLLSRGCYTFVYMSLI